MSREENSIRKGQRKARDFTRKIKRNVESSKTKKTIVEGVEKLGAQASEFVESSGIKEHLKPVAGTTKGAIEAGKEAIQRVDEAAGAGKKLGAARDMLIGTTVTPTKEFLAKSGVTEKVDRAVDKSQETYGNIRELIKPYFAPEDTIELLTNTKKQLTKITACILQVSDKEAAGWMEGFGKVVSAKLAGLVGTTSLFGLVSTFGTAGTGTAIATLHGAALTNSTLAALGFGGGMAAGALVLSGFGLVIGFATYKFALSSKSRNYDDLSDEEKRIVETCGLLAASIESKLEERPLHLYSDEALQFCDSLQKLHEHLEENADSISANLDGINSLKYNQHILTDFKPAVLDGFQFYAAKSPLSPAGLVAGVFYSLLTQTALDGSLEQDLVLDAIRRSKTELNAADEVEISEYLSGLTPERLRGVANNVKGIYHELRWVEEYNASHTDTYAEVHGSTNHEESDVVIRSTDTDEIQYEYQLKATNSKSYVAEHQDRYSDIEIIVTDEVADKMDGVQASDHTNEDLTRDVASTSENLSGNTIPDRVFESGEYAGLIAAGFEALKLLDGKTTIPAAGKNTIQTAANAAAATGITAFLFG
ncbi:MAG: hypothetical protein ABJ081_05220 [Hyphomicrobiales bacterium]